ncbi:MAG: hypothetical protein ACOY0T_11720 [Myxococcota bacterium]
MSFEAVLDELCRTEGLVGALLFDSARCCVARRLPTALDNQSLAETCERVHGVFDALSSLAEGVPDDFALAGDEGMLFLRHVHGHWLLVLSDSNVNLSVLGVVLNVAALAIERCLQAEATLPRASNSLASGQREAAPAADVVPLVVVRALLDLYAEHLGPAAKPIFKQQLSEIGATSRTLRRADVPNFVARLSERIPIAHARAEFSRGARLYGERMLLL